MALVAYTLTLYPSVPGGDSGELIAAAHRLGVAHPPGYPLYTLLGKAFTWIPFSSIAWRMNFFSAVAAAGAAVLLCLAVARWTSNIWAGVLAAGLFAFSNRVWAQANAAEVFALNNLFVAALLYLAVRHAETIGIEYAKAGAFVLGLGLSHHHVLAFYGLPLILWSFMTRPVLLKPRNLAVLGALFLLGLLPYLYLPLASMSHPDPAWGDQTTLSGFLNHLLRTEYGTLRLAGEAFSGESFFWQSSRAYFADLMRDTLFAGILIAAWGLLAAFRDPRWRPVAIWSACAWSFYLVTFHALSNLPLNTPLFVAVQGRFWQQLDLIVCAWIGLGWAALWSRSVQHRMFAPAGAIAAVAVVTLQLGLGFSRNDQHDNRLIRDFAHALLRPISKDGLMLVRGDLISNPVRYLQLCEGVRADIRILDQEMMTFPWMKRLAEAHLPGVTIPGARYHVREADAYDMKRFLEANIDRFDTYVCRDFKPGDNRHESDFQLWPIGMCFAVARKTAPFDFDTWVVRNENALPELDPAFQKRWPEDSWEYHAARDYWEARRRRGNRALTYAIEHGDDRAALQLAATVLEHLVKLDPRPEAAAFKDLGIAYNRLAPYDPSMAAKMVDAWRTYLKLTPSADPDPDLPKIREAVRSL